MNDIEASVFVFILIEQYNTHTHWDRLLDVLQDGEDGILEQELLEFLLFVDIDLFYGLRQMLEMTIEEGFQGLAWDFTFFNHCL